MSTYTFGGVQFELRHELRYKHSLERGESVCGSCALKPRSCTSLSRDPSTNHDARSACGSDGYFIVANTEHDKDRYALLKLQGRV